MSSVLLCLQPVCTTEIGRLALKYKELSGKGVKIATLSADPVRDYLTPSSEQGCSDTSLPDGLHASCSVSTDVMQHDCRIEAG